MSLYRLADPAVTRLLPLKNRSARRFVEREGLAIRVGRLVMVDIAALSDRMRTPASIQTNA